MLKMLTNFSNSKIWKIFKTFSYYLYKSKSIILIIGFLSLAIFSINIYLVVKDSNNFIKYNKIWNFETIFLAMIVILIFSWNIASKTIADSWMFSILSTKTSRIKIWLIMYLNVYLWSFIITFLFTIIKEIIWTIIGINLHAHASLEWITFGISLCLNLFFTSIYLIVCNNFKLISGLIIGFLLTLVNILLCSIPFISSLNQKYSQLNWDLKNNQYNYVELVNPKNHHQKYYAYFLNKNNILDNKVISKNDVFSLLSPIEQFYDPHLKTKKLFDIYNSNLTFSTVNINLNKLGSPYVVLDNNHDYFSYKLGTSLFDKTQEQIENEITNYFSSIKDPRITKHIQKFQETLLQMNTPWTSLTQELKNAIRIFVGNLKNDLMFYIFRDFSKVENYFPNLIEHLYEKNNKSIVDFWKYIITNQIARENIFKSILVFNKGELANNYPVFDIVDQSHNVTEENIKEMKNLISNIHFDLQKNKWFAKIKINNSLSEKYHDFDISGKFLENILFSLSKDPTKNTWDEYIDQNSEYANLQDVYKKLDKIIIDNNFENNEKYLISNVVFENNWHNFNNLDVIFKLKNQSLSSNHGTIIIVAAILFAIFIAIIDVLLFMRKDILDR